MGPQSGRFTSLSLRVFTGRQGWSCPSLQSWRDGGTKYLAWCPGTWWRGWWEQGYPCYQWPGWSPPPVWNDEPSILCVNSLGPSWRVCWPWDFFLKTCSEGDIHHWGPGEAGGPDQTRGCGKGCLDCGWAPWRFLFIPGLDYHFTKAAVNDISVHFLKGTGVKRAWAPALP